MRRSRAVSKKNNRVLKTAPLSQLEGAKPRAFPDGLAGTGDYVYEVDKDYITEKNPYGVGVAVGCVLHPHGNEWKIKWMDGSVEMTPKKFLRKCPQIDDLLTDGDSCFKLVSHKKKGSRLQILDAVPKKFQTKFAKARKKLQQKNAKPVGVAVVAAPASIAPRTCPRTSPRKKKQAKKSKEKLPQHNADEDKKVTTPIGRVVVRPRSKPKRLQRCKPRSQRCASLRTGRRESSRSSPNGVCANTRICKNPRCMRTARKF